MRMFKKTKIVATVGPACSSYDNLLDLAQRGVNIFRLNFSHGSHADHLQVIERLELINKNTDLHIGILADLQGPKLRVGKIENNSLILEAGDIVTFVNEPCIGNREKIYMSYTLFANDVEVGERVLLDDGKLIFEVIETNRVDLVRMKVIFGGNLSSNKGVNLPDTKVTQPSLTEKDLIDLEFILTQNVNWIALSFVRSPDDIKDLRERLDAAKHPAKIIAKIEKPEAIERIDKIIKASNAIMIARGDLAVEVPMERLPLIQKSIIAKCIQRARPVIVATQMMESMITNPSPTRAEITDVANAVMDGADALMLSGETSVGDHPALVIDSMVKIIKEVEKEHDLRSSHPLPAPKAGTFLSDVVCINAATVADQVSARGIVGMTNSGYTAFKVSSCRPRCDIFMFSDRPEMLNTLNLVWGVQCFYYNKFTTTDETINDASMILKQEGIVKIGDVLVNTASMPLHRRHRTNMLKLTVVEDSEES
jgi:pyruvate kinase